MAGPGSARQGEAWQGKHTGEAYPSPEAFRFPWRGKARPGAAGRGAARRGWARHGEANTRGRRESPPKLSDFHGRPWRGAAGHGLAWRGIGTNTGRGRKSPARSLDIQCPIPYNRITMNTTAIEQLKQSIQRAPDVIMGEWTSRDSSLCCPAALTCRAVGVHLRDAYHLASPILQITDTQADRLCYIDGWSDRDTTAWLTSKSPAQRKRLILKQIAAIERS